MPLNTGYLTAKTDKASDEYYTPEYAVNPILKHLKTFAKNKSPITIWCPFDKENSEFVKILKRHQYNVIATHIDDDETGTHNFFTYAPENYDVIISNPPFSIKDMILKRLDELNKPYAILLPLPTLQGQGRFNNLKNCQALIFDKRINFYSDEQHTKMATGVAFATIYVCKNFLEKDLIFEELDR